MAELAFVSTIITIITGLIVFYQYIKPRSLVTWPLLESIVKGWVARIQKDKTVPQLIVGVGRGGAVIASLISGLFGRIPILVNDRVYKWEDKNNRKEEILIPDIVIPKKLLRSVLIVDGEIHSGRTMKFFKKHFENMGALTIQTAVAYIEENHPDRDEEPDYEGFYLKESDRLFRNLPWKLSKSFISDAYTYKDWKLLEKNHIEQEKKRAHAVNIFLINSDIEEEKALLEENLDKKYKSGIQDIVSKLQYGRIGYVFSGESSHHLDLANKLCKKSGAEHVCEKTLDKKTLNDSKKNTNASTIETGLTSDFSKGVMEWWRNEFEDKIKHIYGNDIVIITNKQVIQMLLFNSKIYNINKFKKNMIEYGSITIIERDYDRQLHFRQ